MADQLWVTTRIREEEEDCVNKQEWYHTMPSWPSSTRFATNNAEANKMAQCASPAGMGRKEGYGVYPGVGDLLLLPLFLAVSACV